jgi:hypothetical protein
MRGVIAMVRHQSVFMKTLEDMKRDHPEICSDSWTYDPKRDGRSHSDFIDPFFLLTQIENRRIFDMAVRIDGIYGQTGIDTHLLTTYSTNNYPIIDEPFFSLPQYFGFYDLQNNRPRGNILNLDELTDSHFRGLLEYISSMVTDISDRRAIWSDIQSDSIRGALRNIYMQNRVVSYLPQNDDQRVLYLYFYPEMQVGGRAGALAEFKSGILDLGFREICLTSQEYERIEYIVSVVDRIARGQLLNGAVTRRCLEPLLG